jgi:hypothetical protein
MKLPKCTLLGPGCRHIEITRRGRFSIITHTVVGIRGGRLLKALLSSVRFCISLRAGKGMQDVGMLEDGNVGEDGANH